MFRWLLFLITSFSCSLGFSQEPAPKIQISVTKPKSESFPIGKMIRIEAETTGKKILWRIPEGFDQDACTDRKIILVPQSALAGKKVKIEAITAVADEPATAEIWIQIEGSPIPPGPVDALAEDLRKLFAESAEADKQDSLVKLKLLYQQATTLAKSPTITSVQKLREALGNASTLLVGNSLMPLRRRISEDLAKSLPSADLPLTDALRNDCETTFKKIADALGKIK